MVIYSSRGFGCIRLLGSKTVVLFDPFSKKEAGKDMPAEEASVVLASHAEAADAASNIKGSPFIIAEAGEFERGGVFVYAMPLPEGSGADRVFLVEADGVRALHLGSFSGVELPEAVMDMIERVDVLFVPVGGGAGKDPKTAHALAEEIEPRMVVPIWYGAGGVTQEAVAKEFGVKNGGPIDKLKVDSKNFSSDEMEVVFLT